MNRSSDGELSSFARFVAAGGASIVSAAVVNPFDVVKTRLQAQAAQSSQSGATSSSPSGRLDPCPPQCHRTASSAHAASCQNFSSTADGLQKIVRREGLRALWRGLDTSIIMAVPSVGIYMPLYDILIQKMDDLGPAKFIAAGSLARTAAVLTIAPLDLVRTRTQGFLHPHNVAVTDPPIARMTSAQMWSSLTLAAEKLGAFGRVQLLWRGVGATLSRDVPFSAIYWGILEPIRRFILPSDSSASPSRTLTANMLAGGLGGAIASAATQPLDVVKTRMQLDENRTQGTLRTLAKIARTEGIPGLFTGVTPRAMKATPACAIVLASYEFMKLVLASKHDLQPSQAS